MKHNTPARHHKWQEDLLLVSCRHYSCLNFSLMLLWGASWRCCENVDWHWESQRASSAVWMLIHPWPKRSMAGGNGGAPMGWQHVQVQTVLMERSASGLTLRVLRISWSLCHSKYLKLHIHFTMWVVKRGLSKPGETSLLESRCSGILEPFETWWSGSQGLSPSHWDQKVIRDFST